VSQLEFVNGNMQIVEIDGAPALEVSSASVFRVKLPRVLPDDFTLEFDVKFPALNMGTTVYFAPLETSIARYDYDYVLVGGRPGLYRKGEAVSTAYLPKNQGTWVPVKLQVDSSYAILYAGTERAGQVPTANIARSAAIEFHVNANPRQRAYLKNVVVAVGLNKLYDALTTTGEFVTRGIFFDTDSDRLRPESTPVLQEILTALQQHADLRITIEGHTDSQGEEGHNQSLSERRARAVVAYLEGKGIDGGRLSATGKGESAPMADNATVEGRQQNRRVVLRLAQ
jgi:outer membrane protein OmpA-like peptidoglycan-associated protein